MSILLVEVVPQGMIFGADRNITLSRPLISSDGTQTEYSEEFLGYSQRPKVLRWPQRKALIGYVGAGSIGGLPADEWFYDFIGDNLSFQNFSVLATSLGERVEEQRRIDEGVGKPEPLIIHLGGFEERNNTMAPTVWVM